MRRRGGGTREVRDGGTEFGAGDDRQERRMIYASSKLFRMELSRKEVGRRIAKARRSRGWTQKDLAEAMGLSKGCIVGWEYGLRFPRTHVLGTLANCLPRSLDLILLNRGRNARH